MNDEYDNDKECPGYIHPCGRIVEEGQTYCWDCRQDVQADYDQHHPPLPEMPLP